MKKMFLLLIPLLILTGCMTANQLAAEKAFYEAKVAMVKQQGAHPIVQIIPAETNRPIIMHNVASFTVFAPPQGSGDAPLVQYVQKDYVQPWLNLMGMAVPWLGAWGIVKSATDAIASVPHTNSSSVVNTNSGNTTTTLSNTVTGSGNSTNLGSGTSNWTYTEAPVVVIPPVIVP